MPRLVSVRVTIVVVPAVVLDRFVPWAISMACDECRIVCVWKWVGSSV